MNSLNKERLSYSPHCIPRILGSWCKVLRRQAGGRGRSNLCRHRSSESSIARTVARPGWSCWLAFPSRSSKWLQSPERIEQCRILNEGKKDVEYFRKLSPTFFVLFNHVIKSSEELLYIHTWFSCFMLKISVSPVRKLAWIQVLGLVF